MSFFFCRRIIREFLWDKLNQGKSLRIWNFVGKFLFFVFQGKRTGFSNTYIFCKTIFFSMLITELFVILYSTLRIHCFIPCESNLSNKKKIPEVWSFSLTGQWIYCSLTQKIAFFSTSGKPSQLSRFTVVLCHLSQLSAWMTCLCLTKRLGCGSKPLSVHKIRLK